MITIRDHLEVLGGLDRIAPPTGLTWDDPWAQRLADMPADEMRLVTLDGGQVLGFCGGRCILSFHAERYGRPTTIAYVVLDEGAASAWLANRARGVENDTPICPGVHLRLVVPS